MVKKLACAVVVLSTLTGCGAIQNGLKKCIPTPAYYDQRTVSITNETSTLGKVGSAVSIAAGVFSIVYGIAKSDYYNTNKNVVLLAGGIGSAAGVLAGVGYGIYTHYKTGGSTDGNTESSEGQVAGAGTGSI